MEKPDDKKLLDEQIRLTDAEVAELSKPNPKDTKPEEKDNKAAVEEKEEKEEEKKPDEKPTEKVDEEDFTKEGDEWIFRPDSNEGTVYKGKTKKELLQNIAKGITEKDSFISKLKADQIKAKDVEEIPGDEVAFPKMDEIAKEVFGQLGIDPAMANWTDQQWTEFEAEKGGVIAGRMDRAIEQAKRVISERFAEENLRAINKAQIDEETQNVREFLAEVKESLTAEEYGEVLDKVWNDPKSKNHNGLLRPGTIVREVAKRLRVSATEKISKKAREEAEQEIAKAREKKKQLEKETSSKSIGNFKPYKEGKVPSSMDAAVDEILSEMGRK